MRSGRLFVLIGCVVSAGCGGSGVSTQTNTFGNPDDALRSHLGVQTIRANFHLPRGEDFYFIKVLHFEDGKLLKQGARVGGEVTGSTPRTLEVQLLWSTATSEGKATLWSPSVATHFDDKNLQRLDMGRKSSLRAGDAKEIHEGHHVLGLAQSKQGREGESDSITYGRLAEAIQRKMYVSALVICTFQSREGRDKQW